MSSERVARMTESVATSKEARTVLAILASAGEMAQEAALTGKGGLSEGDGADGPSDEESGDGSDSDDTSGETSDEEEGEDGDLAGAETSTQPPS